MKRTLSPVLRFLFSPRGRMGRAAYAALFAALVALRPLYAAMIKRLEGMVLTVDTPAGLALAAFSSLIVLCLCAAAIKRLHDAGGGGEWLLGAALLALLTWQREIVFLFLAALAVLPGDAGANAYGPPPMTLARARLRLRLWRISRDFVRGRIDADTLNAKRADALNAQRA